MIPLILYTCYNTQVYSLFIQYLLLYITFFILFGLGVVQMLFNDDIIYILQTHNCYCYQILTLHTCSGKMSAYLLTNKVQHKLSTTFVFMMLVYEEKLQNMLLCKNTETTNNDIINN